MIEENRKVPCACPAVSGCVNKLKVLNEETHYCRIETPISTGGARPMTREEFIAAMEAPETPAEILGAMAETFRERGKIYGDNWKRIGGVLHALAGGKPVTISTPEEWLRWSLYVLQVTKLTRLATTSLEHIDSTHDLAVYSAMLEAVQKEQQNG